tara:strand:- start:131 stop:331 length:201 start_codon:yes stop_codon:yes gene_type:complete
MLLNPIERDSRYTIQKEWTGKDKPQFVLRFCDEFICSSSFYGSVAIRAVGHHADRRGALTFVEEKS